MLPPLAAASMIAFLSTNACAQPAPGPPAAVQGDQIWSTEQFVMPSKILGRSFLVQVARPVRPPGAAAWPGKFPAIYLLDGNEMFGALADDAIISAVNGETAPAYVIGIGYPSQSMIDWFIKRQLDLTPVELPAQQRTSFGGQSLPSGGGAAFQRFLTEELRPLIEARYPIGRAILAGHSYGGLFAAHVLLNDPAAFDGYVIASPAIEAEPRLLEQASSFRPPAPLEVIIGVGAEEDAPTLANARELASRLKDHPSGLKVTLEVVPGQGHAGMQLPFYGAALKLALPPTKAGQGGAGAP
jgi:predicted alpha/beta superfamily hydrolase